MTGKQLRKLGLIGFGALAALFLFASSAHAAIQVSVGVDPAQGTVEDVFLLEVKVEGAAQDSVREPTFEKDSKFKIEKQGTASNLRIINGERNQSVTYTFTAIPDPTLRPGKYKLPAGTMLVGNTKYNLTQPSITILSDTDSSRQRAYLGVDFAQVVDNVAPYVGQQIQYNAQILSTRKFSNGEISDLELEGFWREPYGKPQEITKAVGRVTTRIYSLKEAFFPTESGKLTIPARTLSGTIHIRLERSRRRQSSFLFDTFPQLSYDNYKKVRKRFVAPPISLQARPLPTPPIDRPGYVPVGRVKLNAKVDRTELSQSDSVTLTITLSGDANLRPFELPSPEGPDVNHFKTYIDKPSVAASIQNDRLQHVKSFAVAFVPQRSGKLKLPVYRLLVFDPFSEKYTVLQTPEKTLQVKADTQSQTLVTTVPNIAVEPPVVSQDSKKDIALLAEDLLPQHIGKHTFTEAPRLSRFLIWMAVFFFPAAVVSIRATVLHRRKLEADPSISRRQSARNNALSALNDSEKLTGEQAPDHLAAVFRTYLSDRFSVTTSSLTPRELEKLVSNFSGNEDLSARTRNAFDKLQRLRFGANKNILEKVNELKTEIRELIDEIEKV